MNALTKIPRNYTKRHESKKGWVVKGSHAGSFRLDSKIKEQQEEAELDLESYIIARKTDLPISKIKQSIWGNVEILEKREKARWILKTEYLESKLQIKVDNEVILLDSKLIDLYNKIEKSKYILDLQDNFDEEGSLGYSKLTWLRVTRFLCVQYESFYQKFSIILTSPNIYHGPDGSIDLYWSKEQANMLFNIPADENRLATFSASNIETGEKISGEFSIDKIEDKFGFYILSFT